jgi:hypothetical protein
MSIKLFFFKCKDKKFEKSMCFKTLAETVKKISVYDSINYFNVNIIVRVIPPVYLRFAVWRDNVCLRAVEIGSRIRENNMMV